MDTNSNRLRVTTHAKKYPDHYVLVEGTGVLYDMKGNPVWYLPEADRFGTSVVDMQFTPQGTITYLTNQNGYDADFNGKMVWRTPAHDTVCGNEGADYYHHELRKLANGHHMILGTEYMWCRKSCADDTCHILTRPDHNKHTGPAGAAGVAGRGRFGVLVEFDDYDRPVWSWKSSAYLLTSDYVNYEPVDTSWKYEPHDNAFFFDEKNSVIYLSFRNLSRIIKIEYPSGKVLGSYGEVFKKGESQKGSGLYCGQHTITRTGDGYLCLFNNNVHTDTGSLPTVVMLQEPVSENDVLRKVWEYNCTVEKGVNAKFASGGSAIELPDGSVYICMGVGYAKDLIVNRNKEVLWSAVPEINDPVTKQWSVPAIYRSAIISRQELEKLIWKGENGD